MDAATLANELDLMDVIPPDVGRAALYPPELRHAEDFLTNTLSHAAPPAGAGLGDSYAFCAPAFTSPNLLNELANILDEYICPALNKRMAALNASPAAGAPATTFDEFYTNYIFAPQDATYVNNITVNLLQHNPHNCGGSPTTAPELRDHHRNCVPPHLGRSRIDRDDVRGRSPATKAQISRPHQVYWFGLP